MSDNIVQITESANNSIIIDTSLVQNDNIEIQLSSPTSVDVINNTTVLVGDLPQGYPLSWTTENLPFNRISGLDIVGGSGINVINNSGIYTVAVTGNFGLTSEEVDDRVNNLLVAGSYTQLNYNDNSDQLTISVTGLQPSGNYSVVGHSHSSNDIIDFNSSVSGLLPVKNISSGSGISVTNNSGDFTVSVTGQFGLTSEQVDDRVSSLLVAGNYINLNYDDNLDSLTVSVTGVQQSGNYSIVGHSHIISDVSGLQNALDNKQPSGNYANSVHSHITSDITDFSNGVNSLVSGIYAPLISPALTGVPTAPTAPSGTNNNQIANTSFVRSEISNLVNSAPSTLDTLNELATALGNDPNFATTIASGLAQKSNIGHSHSASEITDFNSSVSGLLPSISGSGYVSSNFNNNTYTISVSGLQPSGNYANSTHTHAYTDITNFASGVNNSLTTTLLAGNFINLIYDSNLDTLTIGTSGLQPSGNYSTVGHTHTASDITNFNSSVSGLLPTISNSGDNRVLTSTGSSVGITAESNLTFNGSLLNVTGSGSFSNNVAASGFVRTGGTSSQFLKADGSVDSNTYYLNSNPSGYTTNVGTVTNVSSLNITTSGTDISSSVVNGSTTPVITLNIPSASSTNRGLLSSSDWTTFNNKQPSGVYASGIHYHSSSDITDFNSSVSGLIPVKDIVAGTGIGITSSSGIYTINTSNVPESASLVTNVFNKTASTINKGSVVYINGGQGDQPTIQLAIAANEMGSSKTYGIAQSNIPSMSAGKVVVAGALTGFDTDQYNPTAPTGDVNGTTLWLSPTTSGIMTTTKPSAPYHMVSVGTIVRTHQNEGVIEVKIQNGFELEELHNVAISGVQNHEFLVYHTGVNNLWQNTTLSTSYISDFNSSVSGLLPVTNITGGSNITVSQSGTNFTVAVTGSLGLTTEEVDDRVSSLLVAGTGISLSYDDGLNTLTINTSGLQPSGNYANSVHTHTSSDITNFNSSVSGLLPTIANSGDNRVLTSTGSSLGVNAESNLTFTGSNLGVNTSSPSGALHVVGSGLIASVTGTIPNSLFHLYSATSGANIFNVEGTNGSLFSVDDNLSGTLMSVNNNAGLPVFEVFSDDRVVGGRFNQNDFVINSSGNIGIGNSGDNNYKLNVTGNVNVSGTINVSGVPLGEFIDDEVAGLLVAGSGITLSYNDSLNSLTISVIKNTILSDVVGSTNYIGSAVEGSSISSGVWTINRTIYDSAGSVSSVGTATNVAWTNRSSASYT